ncbi:hypothetical protein BS50DRAFT_232474 [Corynespora cassiicola Philippines]|uniref:Protein kinase domain-containing protein n=1 Tax=Corynespora cassiicola Philippines TaxID=1448308 RepID=A0A2T2P2R1_CORCC|nr:hypothetical protein BS50DRAFT_232474 [Corynespora cassiicola Philippines]
MAKLTQDTILNTTKTSKVDTTGAGFKSNPDSATNSPSEEHHSWNQVPQLVHKPDSHVGAKADKPRKPGSAKILRRQATKSKSLRGLLGSLTGKLGDFADLIVAKPATGLESHITGRAKKLINFHKCLKDGFAGNYKYEVRDLTSEEVHQLGIYSPEHYQPQLRLIPSSTFAQDSPFSSSSSSFIFIEAPKTSNGLIESKNHEIAPEHRMAPTSILKADAVVQDKVQPAGYGFVYSSISACSSLDANTNAPTPAASLPTVFPKTSTSTGAPTLAVTPSASAPGVSILGVSNPEDSPLEAHSSVAHTPELSVGVASSPLSAQASHTEINIQAHVNEEVSAGDGNDPEHSPMVEEFRDSSYLAEHIPKAQFVALIRTVLDLTSDDAAEISVVGKAAGSFNFVRFVKCNNKTFAVKMPSITGQYWDKKRADVLRSEAKTMELIHQRLGDKFPIPKVFGYDGGTENEIGHPYIVMEKVDGIPAYHIWQNLVSEKGGAYYLADEDASTARKEVFLKSLAHRISHLKELRFNKIGRLMPGEDGDLTIGPFATVFMDKEDQYIIKEWMTYEKAADFYADGLHNQKFINTDALNSEQHAIITGINRIVETLLDMEPMNASIVAAENTSSYGSQYASQGPGSLSIPRQTKEEDFDLSQHAQQRSQRPASSRDLDNQHTSTRSRSQHSKSPSHCSQNLSVRSSSRRSRSRSPSREDESTNTSPRSNRERSPIRTPSPPRSPLRSTYSEKLSSRSPSPPSPLHHDQSDIFKIAEGAESFVLNHPDLNLQNIMCDPATGEVTGIIGMFSSLGPSFNRTITIPQTGRAPASSPAP